MHRFLRNRRDIAALLLRTAMLFVAANVVFAALDPMPWLSKATLYNRVFPGRERLPFLGVEGVFSPTTHDIDAMFASHRIAAPAAADEFRVVLVGDSTVRGAGMDKNETYAGRLNAAQLRTSDGRRMRFYSLGIVNSSVLRDALVIQKSLQFEPDLILWFVVMQTLNDKNLFGQELVRSNKASVQRFADRHALHIDGLSVPPETFFDRSIIGRRTRLKQIIELQLSGIMWSISGMESSLNFAELAPKPEKPNQSLRWSGYAPPKLPAGAMRFDIMAAVLAEAGPVPLIIVNEPIRTADDVDQSTRYNHGYPRWAYDDYREQLHRFAAERSVPLIDIGNLLPSNEMIDNLHPWPAGTKRVGDHIARELVLRMGATQGR
jgi:hypothetical protein